MGRKPLAGEKVKEEKANQETTKESVDLGEISEAETVYGEKFEGKVKVKVMG